VNDLDAQQLQRENNRRLLLLLQPSTLRTPQLSTDAALAQTDNAHHSGGMLEGLGMRSAMNARMDVVMYDATGKARSWRKRTTLMQSLGSLTEEVGRSQSQREDDMESDEGDDWQECMLGTPSLAEKRHSPMAHSVNSGEAPRSLNGAKQEMKESAEQTREFEQQSISIGENVAQRVAEILAACEEIRDRIPALSSTDKQFGALGFVQDARSLGASADQRAGADQRTGTAEATPDVRQSAACRHQGDGTAPIPGFWCGPEAPRIVKLCSDPSQTGQASAQGSIAQQTRFMPSSRSNFSQQFMPSSRSNFSQQVAQHSPEHALPP